MRLRKIIRCFEAGSVCVTGQRGTGKDMLMANVIAYRKAPYVSIMDYECASSEYHLLDFAALSMGGITYRDLISGNFKKFKYPYPEGADIYITDIGVFFPSQYCNELNKLYPSIPLFMALSRHIADCNVHLNVQNLNRAWDKFREQSDQYITCNRCFVFFKGKIVLQRITIYDRADSCQARVRPCRVRRGRGKEARANVDIYRDNFFNTHGEIRSHWLLYRNKSNYDTRFFKSLLVEESIS